VNEHHSEPPHQGHVDAAVLIGSIYLWGQGVAVDYARAMAGYKVGAKAGHPVCQFQVGTMSFRGIGVDVDYEEAWAWFEKSAAQDYAEVCGWGVYCCDFLLLPIAPSVSCS